jgi:hypothetical protein
MLDSRHAEEDQDGDDAQELDEPDPLDKRDRGIQTFDPVVQKVPFYRHLVLDPLDLFDTLFMRLCLQF